MSRLKGVFVIVASVFVTTAVVFTGFRIYRTVVVEKMSRAQYVLRTIIQTGPEKEALPTGYLAELMGLSIDQPQNYFTFDEEEAREKLIKSPVIKRARVKKIKPDTVYVDYAVFKPIALVGDGTQLAIDEEGHLFPLAPFFSPKYLPILYFGMQENTVVVEREKFAVALALLAYLDRREVFQESEVCVIDVSEAVHESFGKREVVLTLKEKGAVWYLRLTPHKFPEELHHYVTLRESVLSHSKNKKVVDLRLAKMAYIEEIPL